MLQNRLNELDASQSKSDTIDLSQYLNTIQRYYLRIIGLAFFLTVLMGLFVYTLTPQYIAKTSLLIESDQANVLSIEEVYGLDSSRKEYFETQYAILRSRQIAEKVVLNLSLYEQPEFDLSVINEQRGVFSTSKQLVKEAIRNSLPFLPQENTTIQTEEELFDARVSNAVKAVMSRTSITPIRNTQVVEIAFETSRPELASLIANTVAEEYIDSYLESKLEMTAKATAWLNESLEGLRGKLNNAESLLSEFDEREQLVDIDGVLSLSSENLQNLSNQMSQAQIVLQRSATIYQQVVKAEASIMELSVLPEVLNHPSIQNIKREEVLAQSKVSELKEVFGPKHPAMIAGLAELSSIKGSLNDQIRTLVSGITREYETATKKVDALADDIEIAKREFRKLNNLNSKRSSLQREVDINQQLYDSFFTRLKETNEIGGFESANARVLDSAIPPNFPSKPKKSLILAVCFILSLSLGVFLSLLLEVLNSGIRSVDDVERKLGQRMLGIIPWQPHKKKENLALRHFFDSKHHVFSESVRTLRTSLQLLNLDKPSQTILVTSSVPKEGKSTVSINLAFAMGQLSKVLIVDTDLRRPSIGKQFDLPGFQPGLANLIAGTHTFEECIFNDEQSGVDVIGAGTLPPNPQELLASERFNTIVKDLREQYDYIIMDSAPTQAVSDSVLVSKYCDSILYVVRADSTSDKVINQGLSRFLQIGHRVDGVVLNQVDLNKAKKTGAYSGFYDQYGYNNYSQTSNQKS